MNRAQLVDEYARLQARSRARGRDLDMTRGKPSAAQLDLSDAILSLPGDDLAANLAAAGGVDARNYGGVDGLPAMRRLFAEILEVEAKNVIVGGNSSLSMMYDALLRACQFGVVDGAGPWQGSGLERKFICPSPGYDRHFLLTEQLGFQLQPVDMTATGPDMRQVEALAGADSAVRGIWCVPKYSNPTGACYSADTVAALASMKTAAQDFRIMWDNAYAEHHFTERRPPLANIAQHCEAAGHANRVLQFASTSKMCHPGSGVAAMAASAANIAEARAHIAVQSIGPDKVNQLRALGLFGDLAGLRAHMQRHAALVRPKFDLVVEILRRELTAIAHWSEPEGGYFICLQTPDGCAKRAIRLAAEAGVKLTAAGAPFPYGKDARDRIIRIAPTHPPLDDIRQATEVLVACVKLAISE